MTRHARIIRLHDSRELVEGYVHVAVADSAKFDVKFYIVISADASLDRNSEISAILVHDSTL